MKLSNFRQNSTAAEEGVWVDLGDGLEVKIARSGSKNYNKTIKRLTKPYQTAIRNKTVSDEVYDNIMTQTIAEAVLLGWKGLEDESGNVIEYTPGNALKLLNDPDYRDFRDLILDLSNEQETFRLREVAATAEKS